MEIHMKISLPLRPNFIAEWTWLSKNPVKENGRLTLKSDWPGNKTIFKNKWDMTLALPEHYQLQMCFACQYPGVYTGEDLLNCGACPVKWSTSHCGKYRSEYERWCRAKTPKKRSQLAFIIAGLWREEK